MTPHIRILVLLVTAALTVECSRFRSADEDATLHAMASLKGWAPYDGPLLPTPRRFPTATPIPGGAIVFGGLDARGALAEGWRWDGTRWHGLANDGSPTGRSAHAAAWTGASLCIWGGSSGGTSLSDGACWDAATDRWQTMPGDAPLAPRGAMASAFTAYGWVLWGGRNADGDDYGDGARYDPAARRWYALPEGGPRPRRGAYTAVSPDGQRVLIWGGAGEALALGAEDAFILELRVSRWTAIDLEGAPPARTGPIAVEVPEGLVAVGRDGAAVFEWSTGRWRRLEAPPLSPRWGLTAVAGLGGVILWGGRDEAGARGDGAVLDLSTGVWTLLPTDGAPGARVDAVGIADPHQVLVLWGTDDSGLRSDAFALR